MTAANTAPARKASLPPVRLRSHPDGASSGPEPHELLEIARNREPDDDTAIRWILHEDERVPRAFVFTGGASHAFMRDLLYQRAMSDANNEGVVWTPLLDAMAYMHRWSLDLKAKRSPKAEQRRAAWVLPDSWNEPIERYRTPDEQLGPLGAWIATAKPEDVLPLLQFHSDAIWGLVAAHISHFDTQILQALLDRPATLPDILANRALTREQREQIGWWTIAVLRRKRKPRGVPPGGLIVRGATAHDVWRYAKDVILTAEMQRLVLPLLRFPVWPDGIDSSTPEPEVVSCMAERYLLDRRASLDVGVQAELAGIFRRNGYGLRRLIGHPSATDVVWREAASEVADDSVRGALIEHPKARRDPKVRRALWRYVERLESELAAVEDDSPGNGRANDLSPTTRDIHATLRALAFEASPDEMVECWPRILSIQPLTALEILEVGETDGLAALTSTDLESLLAGLMSTESVRRALAAAARVPDGGIDGGGNAWLAGRGANWVKTIICNAEETLTLLESTPAALAGLSRSDLRPLLVNPGDPELRRRAHRLIVQMPAVRGEVVSGAEDKISANPHRAPESTSAVRSPSRRVI